MPAITRRLLFALLIVPSLFAEPRFVTLQRDADAATKAGDIPSALGKTEEAARLRPDHAHLQLALARSYAAQNRPEAALAALQRLVEMGLRMNLADDPALAPLRSSSRFLTLTSALAAGPAAIAAPGETTFTLDGMTGIIECGMLDPTTRDWYFSDVRQRCIWKRAAGPGSAVLQKFTSDSDPLDGVFKLTLSSDRKTLWASTATVSVMTGPDAVDGQRSALMALDFATGRVRAHYPVPNDGRRHLLGDFIFAPDSSLYATDSFSPVIWRLPAGGGHLEPWLESDQFINLQGLAFAPDGQSIFVADYGNGIWRIEIATKAISLLTPPGNASFFGIDGLYAVPHGLLAVQNGVNPQRILHIEPSTRGPSTTRIVAMGRPAMTDLSLGTLFQGSFYFVADSGWALFDPPAGSPPPARAITIYSISVPGRRESERLYRSPGRPEKVRRQML